MNSFRARRGVSIKIFLIEGTPQGPRLSDKSGWTGSCLDFARSDFAQMRLREEVSRTGVYVLVGDDPADGGLRQRVYVGEGDAVRTRLDQHQKDREFWTRCFVFTSKDDSLNKAHVRYLEARLVALAEKAGVAVLDNNTAPVARGLSEAERDDMESYLDEVLLLLPLLGVQAFSQLVIPNPDRREPPVASLLGEGPRLAASLTSDDQDADRSMASVLPESEVPYFLKEVGRGSRAVGVSAEARDTALGFIVLEGSTGPAEDAVMSAGYASLRKQLREDGTLASDPSDHRALVLTRPYPFKAPSAAATVMAGSNRPGTTAWKDAHGTSLADHRAATTP